VKKDLATNSHEFTRKTHECGYVFVFLCVYSWLVFFPLNVAAQGSLELSGRVKIGTKVEKVERKRFYLFRGGLEANKPMIERIKAAAYTSRDCFYCQAKASPQFIAWLKAEDCESPYCRAISTEDVTKVPEFQVAYQKGLKQFRNKPDVARNWLTTDLTPALRDGFYKQAKASTMTILGTTKPVQSSMTDSVSVVAIFLDIAIQPAAGKTVETFTVSNLVPIEIGGKGYVFTCEVDIGAAKKVKLPQFQVNDAGKAMSKKCDVVVRDLAACDAGVCAVK
jgi:hypothetical protein